MKLIRIIFYALLATAMIVALVASFFPTPGVPDFAYANGVIY